MELLALSKALTMLSKENFVSKFENWLEKHKDFLNERSINEKDKAVFMHIRDD